MYPIVIAFQFILLECLHIYVMWDLHRCWSFSRCKSVCKVSKFGDCEQSVAYVSSFALGRIGIDHISGSLPPQISRILCLPVTREKYFSGLTFIYNIQFEDLFERSLNRKRRSPPNTIEFFLGMILFTTPWSSWISWFYKLVLVFRWHFQLCITSLKMVDTLNGFNEWLNVQE